MSRLWPDPNQWGAICQTDAVLASIFVVSPSMISPGGLDANSGKAATSWSKAKNKLKSISKLHHRFRSHGHCINADPKITDLFFLSN